MDHPAQEPREREQSPDEIALEVRLERLMHWQRGAQDASTGQPCETYQSDSYKEGWSWFHNNPVARIMEQREAYLSHLRQSTSDLKDRINRIKVTAEHLSQPVGRSETQTEQDHGAGPARTSSIQDTSVVNERSEISATLPSGVDLIATERQRQMAVEGWTPEHDDSHEGAELLQAALWYLDDGADYSFVLHLPPWPFEPDAWKSSTDAVRQLVKAGALIAAEIDRMQRRALEAKE